MGLSENGVYMGVPSNSHLWNVHNHLCRDTLSRLAVYWGCLLKIWTVASCSAPANDKEYIQCITEVKQRNNKPFTIRAYWCINVPLFEIIYNTLQKLRIGDGLLLGFPTSSRRCKYATKHETFSASYQPRRSETALETAKLVARAWVSGSLDLCVLACCWFLSDVVCISTQSSKLCS